MASGTDSSLHGTTHPGKRLRADGELTIREKVVQVRELTRITYVEDEPDIRAITQITLEAIGGFTLNVCASGQEAVAAVSAFRPDMILLDIMMPGMDGVQTYHCLRAMPDMMDVPIVFLTAKAQRHELNGYEALGAAAVISKPFDPITLPDQLRSIWERASAARSLKG
jgi:CheY-like chemotaxis protein